MDTFDNNFFAELNVIIKTWLENDLNKLYYKELKKIVPLAFIIINNTPILKEMKINEYVSINDSIKLVIQFFNSINPEYAYIIQNIINLEKSPFNGREDFSVKFYRVFDRDSEYYNEKCEYRDSFVNLNGEVHIRYFNSITDAFTIAHEMTHKISYPYKQFNFIKLFLAETTSTEIEFLLYDYLMRRELFIKDCNLNMVNIFAIMYKEAFKVVFDYTLLKLYEENNNHLNLQILLNYLSTLGNETILYKLFNIYGLSYLRSIVKNNNLHFKSSQRYVIGILVTCDFYKRKKQGENVLNELFKLIDILGRGYTTERDFDELKSFLPIIDGNGFNISDSYLERLTMSYKSVLEEVLNKQDILENNKEL